MLCLVTSSKPITARSRQMQLQMPCPVILWESPTKDLWGPTLSSLTLSSLTLSSLTLSSLTLRVYSSDFTLHGLTLLSLTLSALRTSSVLCTLSTLYPLHQILVCALVLSRSHQLWDAFRSELADDPTKPTLVAWDWGCKDYRTKTIKAR